MVEIKKRFFTKLDREEESKHTEADLYSEAACRRVAFVYSDCAFKWSGRKAFFLPANIGQKNKEERLGQIRKLITIVSDLGVPMEVYINIQFDIQMPGQLKIGQSAIPFVRLISKRAIGLFKECTDSKKDSYSVFNLNIRKSIEDSANEMLKRFDVLLKFDKFNEQAIITEAEVMAQSGAISDVYIYMSPLANCGKSNYLDEIYLRVDKKLNEFEKQEAKRVKVEFIKTITDKRTVKYV